ncbi:MAG: hypothetical protein ACXQS8_05460 [Candidatus Helarchaeales archaeon]
MEIFAINNRKKIIVNIFFIVIFILMINNEGSFNFDEIIAKDSKKNGTVAIILKLSMKKHFSLIFFKDGKISHAIKKKYLKTFDKTIGSCS